MVVFKSIFLFVSYLFLLLFVPVLSLLPFDYLYDSILSLLLAIIFCFVIVMVSLYIFNVSQSTSK